MKQEDARRRIISLFRKWCEKERIEHPTGTDAFLFYNILDMRDDPALQFRTKGVGDDRWQTVHGWLRNAGLVKD